MFKAVWKPSDLCICGPLSAGFLSREIFEVGPCRALIYVPRWKGFEDNKFHGTLGVIKSHKLDSSFFFDFLIFGFESFANFYYGFPEFLIPKTLMCFGCFP